MKVVNIHEAKNTFSQLLELVMAGNEVIISKAGKPLARLIPYQIEKKPRTPGYWKDRVKMSPDFDAPLPPEIFASFMDMDDIKIV